MIFFDSQIIIILQALLPYVAWELLNLFGDPIIYIILLAIAFWCVNKREGNITIIFVMFSGFINILLKYAFGMPRPPAELRQNPEYIADQSYGFPSGSSQISTTFWGWVTIKIRRWWVAICSIIIIISTALARMGLGLHYLGDVIGGIIIGIILVTWAYYLIPYIRSYWKHMPLMHQNWLLPVVALVFFFLYFIAYAIGLPYFPTENIALSMGVVFGFSVGATMEKQYVNFSTDVKKTTKINRAILGIFIALITYYALTAAFSLIPTISLLEYTLRFIKYIIIGFFGSFLLPLLFNTLEKRGKMAASTELK